MSFSGTKGYPTKPKSGVILNPLHPLSRGLVGHWLFNEGAGSLVNDISGHGNHGRLTNMSPNAQGSGWGGSKFGGGLNFDGSNDYVNVLDHSHIQDIFTNGGTISIWFNANTKGESNYPRIVSKRSVTVDGWETSIYDTGNRNISFWKSFDNTNAEWRTTSSITYGSQQNLTIVYNSNSVNNNPLIYINGILQPITEVSTPIGTADSDVGIDLLFGERADFIRAYDGLIGPVYFYNRMLPVTEVKQLYHEPFCNLLQVPIRRYSVIAPPVGAIMNQFQMNNLGADLYDGAIIA